MQHPFRSFANKFRRNLEDYGFKITFLKILQGVFGIVFKKVTYTIYRKDLSTVQLQAADLELPPGLSFKELTPGQSGLIAQVEEIAEWLQGELAGILGAGNLCLAILEGDKIAAFNIICFGKVYMPLVNYHKTFRKRAAWSEHIAVAGAYRRRGLAIKLRYHVFGRLQDLSVRYLYGGALRGNTASLKLAARLGFTYLYNLTYYKILMSKKWSLRRIRQ